MKEELKDKCRITKKELDRMVGECRARTTILKQVSKGERLSECKNTVIVRFVFLGTGKVGDSKTVKEVKELRFDIAEPSDLKMYNDGAIWRNIRRYLNESYSLVNGKYVFRFQVDFLYKITLRWENGKDYIDETRPGISMMLFESKDPAMMSEFVMNNV